MIAGASTSKTRPFGPHSRALSRGAVGEGLDGRSREGRFVRQAERELLDQIGGDPGFAQRMIVRRAAKMMLLAEQLDKRVGAGSCGSEDAKLLDQLNGSIRAALADLGLAGKA